MKKKILTISLISIFSVLLWVFVSLSHDFFTSANFPITFTNIPKGYVISDVSANNVTISLKGEGWLLGQIVFGRSPKFLIDIKKRKGKQKILSKNYVNSNSWLSSNLQIIDVSPTVITFNVVRSAKKKVKINPSNITYSVKDGFIAPLPIKLNPDSVWVVGPRKKVRSLKTIFTERMVFKDLQKTMIIQVNLLPIKNIKFLKSKVRAVIGIEKIADKTFNDIPVIVKKVPPGRMLEVFPPKIKVSLRGGLNQLAELKSNRIKAVIYYYQALKDTTGVISPNIEIPENMQLLTVEPAKLKYIIKR